MYSGPRPTDEEFEALKMRRDEAMTMLRDRCKEMYQRLQRDAVLRQGSPVDNLMAFVIAEKGCAADARAEGMMTGQRQGLAQAKVIAERLHDELNEKMADPEANRGALLDQQLGVILVMEALSSETAMDRTCETWLERETREAFREVKGLPHRTLRAMRFEPFAERHGTGKGGDDFAPEGKGE